ncbi:hypothetical protein [Streptomyces sp. NPDC001652]|uniref:hypothetical protein n=1 Tax=Streptomyces sp. NPDC001652 TaxID=3154393 RepID=UPI0033223390
MKLRNVTLAALATSALLVGAGPAQAAGWDAVGNSTFSYRDVNLSLWFTGYVYSTGGDFQACVGRHNDSYTHQYSLWEHDDTGSKKVATKSGKQGDCFIFRDIGAYVDGSNNKAEFFLGSNDPEGGYEVTFWD